MTAIATLTLNPAIDVSTSTPVLEPANKLRCAVERRDPGGGGLNVARVIHRLGGEVVAIFPAGGPLADMLTSRIAAEHLSCVRIPISGDTRENFTILESSTNREFRFVLPGPELTNAELEACLEAAKIAGGRWVVISGGLPPGAAPEIYTHLVRQARERGARAIVDASGPALTAALKEGVWLAKPNLKELEGYFGRTLATQGERLSAARRLIAAGSAELVALTLGQEGAILVSDREACFAPPLDIAPLSTVGAGDSFLGGMVWGLASGFSLAEAFRHGMAASAATLLKPGTELCQADDVRRLVETVVIHPL